MQAAVIAASTCLPYVPGIVTTKIEIHRQTQDRPRIGPGGAGVAFSYIEITNATST
jgi:hypothetical protein